MILPLRHLSISIKRPVDAVYEFASRPQNLPLWASGLTGAIWKEGEDWVADSPLGRVKILFCEKNDLGVLDHDVILESGQRFHNPMRVIKNHDGSEVIFTLFHLPGMSKDEFERDAYQVMKDLDKLKLLMEQPNHHP